MKIKFFNPKELERNIKATIQSSGKLGFTIEASKKLGLSIEKSADIGINEEDSLDTNLYVVINDSINDGSFRISKAGDYYYINAKLLFDSLKLDYSKNYIVYTITEETIDGNRVFEFKKSEKPKVVNINNKVNEQ